MRRRFERNNRKSTKTMDTIYQQAIEAVRNGARFKVDFPSRSLRLDGRYVIRDGRFEGELGIPPCGTGEFLWDMEVLYCRYKHSVPSERSECKARQYFKALPEKQLDDGDMLYGESRDVAQITLELYLLGWIILGPGWDTETMGRWFYQGKRDKDLVILRDWVEAPRQQSSIK